MIFIFIYFLVKMNKKFKKILILIALFIIIPSCIKYNYLDDNQIKIDENGNTIESFTNINEIPLEILQINKPVLESTKCITNNIKNQFKLNNNFIKIISYDNNAKSIKIYNPYKKIEGIIIYIIPINNISEIKLYANGIPKISKAWLNILKYCKNKN